MEEWISVTAAAQKLSDAGDSVTRSTLSRYLDQHAEALPTKFEGRTRLVEFGALRQHRNENVRIIPQAVTKQKQQLTGSQADGVARKAQADAELREMDLAERRKSLTRVVEVDRAGRDAVALMQSSFERSVETVASDLYLKYGWDERTVRMELKRFSSIGVETFHRVILERLDAMKSKDTMEEV